LILYADTSALAKLLLDESGTLEMRELAEAADVTVTSAIGYVELRSVLAEAKRAGRISDAVSATLAVSMERIWDGLDVLAVDTPLLRRAGDLADEAGLRAYDSVHLATLVTAGAPSDLVFACWDRDLRAAARDLGYPLRPVDLG